MFSISSFCGIDFSNHCSMYVETSSHCKNLGYDCFSKTLQTLRKKKCKLRSIIFAKGLQKKKSFSKPFFLSSNSFLGSHCNMQILLSHSHWDKWFASVLCLNWSMVLGRWFWYDLKVYISDWAKTVARCFLYQGSVLHCSHFITLLLFFIPAV